MTTFRSIVLGAGVSAVLLFGAVTAQAEPKYVAEADRPTLVVSGELATLTFKAGHVPALVEVYGKGISRIKPTGNEVKFKARDHWFNYQGSDGTWALVEDGPKREKWASGIVSEPTKTYGGRAERGAALAPEATAQPLHVRK